MGRFLRKRSAKLYHSRGIQIRPAFAWKSSGPRRSREKAGKYRNPANPRDISIHPYFA